MAQWHTGLARWAPLNILLLKSVSMTHQQISNIIYVSLLSLYVVLGESLMAVKKDYKISQVVMVITRKILNLLRVAGGHE